MTAKQIQNYDYFNNEKIRSIEEFDIETGKITRVTNFILYKSVDEYDLNTGKKVKTTNYNFTDTNKISSVYEYDVNFDSVSKIYIYKKNSDYVSIIKEQAK